MLTAKQQKTLEFIQQYYQEHGLAPTIAEIAQGLGISSRGVVHRYLQALAKSRFIEVLPGRRRNIRLTAAPNMPEAFTQLSLPILGRIAAGKPIEAISDQAYFDISRVLLGPRRFLLEVKGDSMSGDNICDGDFIICEQRQTAKNGEIVIALVRNQEVTLKRIYTYPNGNVHLVPSNPTLLPMIYGVDEIAIQGVYLGLLRVKK